MATSKLSDEAVQSAVALRRLYGLRSDEEWVRQLDSDPEAQAGVVTFGIPLTPSEIADIQGRRWDEDVLASAREYCSSIPEDCAGAYLNLKGNGVVIDIARELDLHRQALAGLIADPDLVVMRDVEWSRAELDEFGAQVEAEREWFAANGLAFLQVDRRVNENFVHVDFRSATEAAVQLVEAHFGNPTWLKANRVGPLPWSGPRGDLVIRVTDDEGQPGAGIRCDLLPKDPRAEEGFADFLIVTDRAGVCTIEHIPAVEYQVRLFRWVNNEDFETEPIKEVGVALTTPTTTIEVLIPSE